MEFKFLHYKQNMRMRPGLIFAAVVFCWISAFFLPEVWADGRASDFETTTVSELPSSNRNLSRNLSRLSGSLSNGDTLQVFIQGGEATEYCIDPSVFDIPGAPTSAGFCNQGNAATVLATNIDNNCLDLVPAAGFTGLSPHLICVVHCFENNFILCDTTYLKVTVENNCDEIFAQDTIVAPYFDYPTPVCIPLSPAVAGNYQLIFNGLELTNLQSCDFDSVLVYTYAFLVGDGFNGSYVLNSWTVNGITYTGFFNNMIELVSLMNTFDPTGNWQINTTANIIYGGNLNQIYGDIKLTHVPSGSESIQMTNFSIVPNGFILNLTNGSQQILIANNLESGCSDTLYINPVFSPPTTDTIYLATTVNTPTPDYCLDGSELPGGTILNIGYCEFASNGAVPLFDNCVFYYPGYNFAGQDTFCILACDGGFPQICDTSVFIVSVLPQRDTIYLTIPPEETSVDTCLSSDFIELPGTIDFAGFCDISLAQINGAIDGACLSFEETGNFYGTTTVCIVYCSDSFCDTTVAIITIESPVICHDIFDQPSLSFLTPDDSVPFCLPIPTSEIGYFNVSVDGIDFTGSFAPCGLVDRVVYDYSSLGPAPYFLESWKIEDDKYFGYMADLEVLTDSLNAWDPAGAWTNDPALAQISGGVSGVNYSDMVVTRIGVETDTLPTQIIQVFSGSQITLSGVGTHEVIMTALNGCADTVAVAIEHHPVSTDTIFLFTPMNTPLSPICFDTDELLGAFAQMNFCSLAANGGLEFASDSCVSYLPTFGFVGNDAFCLVVCDDYLPQVCDTLVAIVSVLAPVDTVYAEAVSTEPFDLCLTGNELQIPGAVFSAEICGLNPDEAAVALFDNCVNIDLAEDFQGLTTICVVHCAEGFPPLCDTTIIIVSFNDAASPCSDFIAPNQELVSLSNDTAEICLPVPVTDILDYQVLLDGSPYANGYAACQTDSAYVYFYGLVYGQGNEGPYSVTWNAYGNTFTATVSNIGDLVGFMNDWDPAGDWELHTSNFTISSGNEAGIYGTLSVLHIAGGAVSELEAGFSGIPTGTLVKITGAGQHLFILTEISTGCADSLTVNALIEANILNITTVENAPSQVVCLDADNLPGTFSQLSVCQEPENGMIIISGNCFTFNPAFGFVGNDQACVVVCDNLGNCDTTLLNISVTPLCSLFDFFPDGLQEFHVTDCYDIEGYCVPILLDSISHFGVLDNGFEYSGGFLVCNSIYTQIQLDTGFHEIIFIHLNTGCKDTLTANVTCDSGPTGCGVAPVSGLQLVADDCNGTAQFCSNIPLFNISNFYLTDNGSPYTGEIESCDLGSQYAAIQLDTGYHQLVFADTIKGCSDTINVWVHCLTQVSVTVEITVEVGDSENFCLEDYGIFLSQIDSIESNCPGNGNASFVFDDASACVAVTGQLTGQDTACFTVHFGDTIATIFIHATVVQPCPDYFPGDILTESISCEQGTGQICLPITLLEMQHKVFSLDGQVYTGSIAPCDYDSIFVLNYSELPNQGNFGPYAVDNWLVNGIGFSTVFNAVQELVDSMNAWDPSGSWQVVFDAASQTTLIEGGNSQSSYGSMKIIQQLTGIEVVLGVNATFVPLGVAIDVPYGTFTLSLTDTLTLCSDALTVQIFCTDNDLVIDTILVGASDTLCLDFSGLPGNLVSVEVACPPGGADPVVFTLENNCVIYEGIEIGTGAACYVACDDMGVCDTTFFQIAVIGDDASHPVAVNDTILTGEGAVVNINVLGNDAITPSVEFTIVSPPLHGEAVFLPNGTINYVPDNGYCDDDVPDVLTYEICNSLGCDTATVFVTVRCQGLEIFDGFSPNGDGVNDFFKISGLQNYPDHVLIVYNRWGNKVLEVANYQNDWNGVWKGKDLPDGTYFYHLDLGDGKKPKSGYVQINR